MPTREEQIKFQTFFFFVFHMSLQGNNVLHLTFHFNKALNVFAATLSLDTYMAWKPPNAKFVVPQDIQDHISGPSTHVWVNADDSIHSIRIVVHHLESSSPVLAMFEATWS